MTIAQPRPNFISLASRLGAILNINAEPGILFLNPVKIVKFIRNQACFLNEAGRGRRRFA